MSITVALPKVIGDGRIDLLLKLIHCSREGDLIVQLDWSKTSQISPAGFAILACLFDTFVEQKTKVKNIHLPKVFRHWPIVRHLSELHRYPVLPDRNIHDFEDKRTIIRGNRAAIDPFFVDRIDEKFSNDLSTDVLYAARLIVNELMQNSVDHGSAEGYYAYAGFWEDEFHIGLLDMGVTIPAKLEQKYRFQDDLEALELSLKKGTSTRRQRLGGFGLYYFFEFLKEGSGKLTVISRGAQVRRYFRTRKSQKNLLKYPLPGTWCFARFPRGGDHALNKN